MPEAAKPNASLSFSGSQGISADGWVRSPASNDRISASRAAATDASVAKFRPPGNLDEVQSEPLWGMFIDALAEVRTLLQSLAIVTSSTSTDTSPPRATAPESSNDVRELGYRLRVIVLRMGVTSPVGIVSPEEIWEARYALVALIDEWLIHHAQWSGKAQWIAWPLERELFGSCAAGRQIFLRIQGMTSCRITSERRSHWAAIYLLVITLGFSGEWRGDAERIAGFEETLRANLAVESAQQRAFPQAYDYRLVSASEARLGSLAPWWRWCCLGLLGYLVVSGVLWVILTAPLSKALAQLGY